MEIGIGVLIVVAAGFAFAVWEVRRKQMSRWLGPYLRDHSRRKSYLPDEEVHILLCIADHYEPKAYGADARRGLERVTTWTSEYPQQFGRFRDSDGRPPRYSFFFPAEEYEPEYLDLLGQMCREGYGEVEIHLHHHDDTPAKLRQTLEDFRDVLVHRHGLLGRDKRTGEVRYAFIHGNWALCNSRPDGKQCGVDNEIEILKATGCFVDMTFPSAPDVTQPPIVNRVYYARNIPGRPRSHEAPVQNGSAGADDLLFVQGPLLLDWRRRKWGLLPRLENGCLQSTQPPSLDRLDTWIRARVGVSQRPDWVFIKLHAHGAPEEAHGTLLGGPMIRFHEELAARAKANPKFHYHYVTAREMYNLARAAETGFRGSVAEAIDFEVTSNLAEKTAGEKQAI